MELTVRPSLIIDCAEIAKAKNDAGLISALADETGQSAQSRHDSPFASVVDQDRLLPRLLIPLIPERPD